MSANKPDKIHPGYRHGNLIVVKDSGERDRKKIYWECQCVCGRKVLVSTQTLRREEITSCGCTSIAPPPYETRMLGKTFGKLTVTEYAGKKGKHSCWKCYCSCGNPEPILVVQDHLLSGATKSCGCVHDKIYEENLKLVAGTSVTKLETRRGKVNKNNTSGYCGVYPHANRRGRTGRWAAQIGFQGKKYNLGSFRTVEEAAAARKEAEEKLYDGFLEWYYEDYLPSVKEEKAQSESSATV